MERVALVLRTQRSREADYRAWLEGSMEQLGDVYARHGIGAKTVLMAGTRFIAHYEVEEKESILRAFADPEAVAMLEGDLAGVLEIDDDPPKVYEEIFTWSVPAPGAVERAGLTLTIQDGQEEAYRDWLVSGVLEELETIWNRNDIYRHDVLASGTKLVAYYECKNRFNVLKAFREPEALVMLIGQLSKILELDPHTPLNLFEEAFSWRSSDERQPA